MNETEIKAAVKELREILQDAQKLLEPKKQNYALIQVVGTKL